MTGVQECHKKLKLKSRSSLNLCLRNPGASEESECASALFVEDGSQWLSNETCQKLTDQ